LPLLRSSMTMSTGPSKTSSSGSQRRKNSGDPSSKKKKPKILDRVAEPGLMTTFGDDFLGFVLSEDEDETAVPTSSKPTREWDVGKPSRSDDRDRDRNRRRDLDRDDGYANKKQRQDASSRRAPWVEDLAWEDCANVSEMCASQSAHHLCDSH
jgi:hypothetical protein